MAKKFERHESRLATTDEKGRRVYLYPEDVKGFWRKRRTTFYWILISIYLILPWLSFKGKQIILLDIVNREFTFFGSTFYAHNAPLLFFVLLTIPLTIGLLTTLYGRVWCGWACPQTVFIDAIYLKIERLVEGKARAREKRDQSPMNLEKFIRKSVKWGLFVIVSLHIAHSFIGYFVGARELFWITLSPPWENPALFTTTMVISAIFLFDFGWFREQFCIVACPYGRFQSVMMDENSLVVAYDQKRGEPRRAPDVAAENEGDCINCYQCVKVCPTGIDIRRGTQLECIACTNCIDACDDIMTKLDRPKGLIRYASETQLEGKERKAWSIRSSIYLGIIFLVVSAFIYSLGQRSDYDIVILNTGSTPYQMSERESYTEITNQRQLNLSTTADGTTLIKIELAPSSHEDIQLVVPRNPWSIQRGHNSTPFFLRYPQAVLEDGRGSVTLYIFNHETGELIKQEEVVLVGPGRN